MTVPLFLRVSVTLHDFQCTVCSHTGHRIRVNIDLSHGKRYIRRQRFTLFVIHTVYRCLPCLINLSAFVRTASLCLKLDRDFLLSEILSPFDLSRETQPLYNSRSRIFVFILNYVNSGRLINIQ